jgi:Glycosyltransferase family 87
MQAARRSLALALVLVGLSAGSAAASTPAPPTGGVWPFKALPQGVSVRPRDALAVADRTTGARRLRATGHTGRVYFKRLVSGGGVWEVAYAGRRNVLAEVDVDGRSGRVVATWTGWHANYALTRGHFGGLADSWWVWLPLCLLFVAPFFDARRPFRLLHFDLLALLAFGVSHLFYNQGDVLVSVPLVYPVLAYLLARMLWLGFGPARAHGPLVPHARSAWLVAGIVLLVGFRIFVNLDTAKVLDVGDAGVIGAGAIEHNRPIYVGDRLHRDTYGPLNYLTYLPFVLVSPSSVYSDAKPAAHMASLCFDLLVILGLYLVGRRLRAGPAGRRLGVALAFAWAACPYTLYAAALNTNDALVAALLVFGFLAMDSPRIRGMTIGGAVGAKFAPLALVPLLLHSGGEKRLRQAVLFGSAFVATLVVLFGPYVRKPGLAAMWHLTVGYQLHRTTPLSLWTLYPSLAWLKVALTVGAVLLATVLAFVPRRREGAQAAALAAAVLIATQLPAGYWFYFYVVWFAPFVLIALFTRQVHGSPDSRPRRSAPAQVSP